MSNPTPPPVTEVLAYLPVGRWTNAQVQSAYAAEIAAQSRVVRFPEGETDYPADLAQALFRRTHRNLELRSLPYGTQPSADGIGNIRVGGTDPETRRLEAPFRKLVIG